MCSPKQYAGAYALITPTKAATCLILDRCVKSRTGVAVRINLSNLSSVSDTSICRVSSQKSKDFSFCVGLRTDLVTCMKKPVAVNNVHRSLTARRQAVLESAIIKESSMYGNIVEKIGLRMVVNNRGAQAKPFGRQVNSYNWPSQKNHRYLRCWLMIGIV